jgi:hypothetical protein
MSERRERKKLLHKVLMTTIHEFEMGGENNNEYDAIDRHEGEMLGKKLWREIHIKSKQKCLGTCRKEEWKFQTRLDALSLRRGEKSELQCLQHDDISGGFGQTLKIAGTKLTKSSESIERSESSLKSE